MPKTLARRPKHIEPRETVAEIIAPFRTGALADALGVHVTTVSRWRSGMVPDEAHVPALARFLGVTEARVRRAIAYTAAQ